MKLLYLSNFLNHHQEPLARAFYKKLGDDYKFVATGGVPSYRKELGYQELDAPYLLLYNQETKLVIDQMIMEADAVIFGQFPIGPVIRRIKAGKITFTDDECTYRSWYRYLKWPVYTYRSFYLNRGYFLFASAFGPIDYKLSGMSSKKCFRWGYWPEVKHYNDIEEIIAKKGLKHPQGVSILWAGRLIGLKHPEAAIYVAKKLKNAGYVFELNIIGTGVLESKIMKMIEDKNLSDKVHLLGSMPPTEVRSYMESADIFLFTSDRNEGWGAVLNESLNSCCAVIGGSNIGSVPSLIEDGVNGVIFKDKDWNNLYEKVIWLIEHPNERKEMGRKAYRTMTELWNGEQASSNFLRLYEALKKGGQSPIEKGPCSQAPVIMRTWRGKFKVL